MNEFFEAVRTFPLLQRAVATAALASVACGVVGTYVVVRRITYLAGGIAHCVLGGMGAAVYLQKVHGWQWLSPLYGAVIAALLGAAVIGLASLRLKQRGDTLISAVWAVGMATGVLFIYMTPGYQQDLMSYLLGSISIVAAEDLWLIGILDAVVLAVALGFYRQLLAVCFDEEFARTRGLAVEAYYLLLLCVTALTVVLLVTVVGIIMVIALLTLPVAIAGQFARRLSRVMIASVALCVGFTLAGLALSYAPSLPPGPTAVVLAGASYLLVVGIQALVRRFRRVGQETPKARP